MTPRELIAAFDVLADAPNGVKRLRELVLQLAVRGKLVPQDPNDEPASVLLERIAAARGQLGDRAVRRTARLAPLGSNVVYEVPAGWAWCRLADLTSSFQNGTSKRRGTGQPTVVVRLADINAGELSDRSLRRINLCASDVAKYAIEVNDILAIRVNGSGDLVGQLVPVHASRGWTYCDHLIRVRVFEGTVVPTYLCHYGKTMSARQHLEVATVTTAGQKTINQTGLGTLPVPLPPLA